MIVPWQGRTVRATGGRRRKSCWRLHGPMTSVGWPFRLVDLSRRLKSWDSRFHEAAWWCGGEEVIDTGEMAFLQS